MGWGEKNVQVLLASEVSLPGWLDSPTMVEETTKVTVCFEEVAWCHWDWYAWVTVGFVLFWKNDKASRRGLQV